MAFMNGITRDGQPRAPMLSHCFIFFPESAFMLLDWLRPGVARGEQNMPFTSEKPPEFWLAPVIKLLLD